MNALKRSVLTLALAAGIAAPTAFAQPPDQPPGPPAAGEKGERRGQPNVAERLKQLSEALGLTEDQITKIKPLLTEEFTAIAALAQDKSLDHKARRAKISEIRDSFAPKIEALLTPEQKTKWEGMKKMRGMMGGKRSDQKPEDKK
jgi:Spy/CpxP family protein refolding chaperone